MAGAEPGRVDPAIFVQAPSNSTRFAIIIKCNFVWPQKLSTSQRAVVWWGKRGMVFLRNWFSFDPKWENVVGEERGGF